MNMKLDLVRMICLVALFMASGCSAPSGSNVTNIGNATNQNANSRTLSSPSTARETPASAKANIPASAPLMGEPVDTSRFDREIARLEAQVNNKPTDQTARRALAAAYLNRADALLRARQYRVALGDYRRVLKYDAENAEARKWSAEIVQIMQSMGREVPAPGTEPTPLPYKT